MFVNKFSSQHDWGVKVMSMPVKGPRLNILNEKIAHA